METDKVSKSKWSEIDGHLGWKQTKLKEDTLKMKKNADPFHPGFFEKEEFQLKSKLSRGQRAKSSKKVDPPKQQSRVEAQTEDQRTEVDMSESFPEFLEPTQDEYSSTSLVDWFEEDEAASFAGLMEKGLAYHFAGSRASSTSEEQDNEEDSAKAIGKVDDQDAGPSNKREIGSQKQDNDEETFRQLFEESQ